MAATALQTAGNMLPFLKAQTFNSAQTGAGLMKILTDQYF